MRMSADKKLGEVSPAGCRGWKDHSCPDIRLYALSTPRHHLRWSGWFEDKVCVCPARQYFHIQPGRGRKADSFRATSTEPMSPACHISSQFSKYFKYLSSQNAWVSDNNPILVIVFFVYYRQRYYIWNKSKHNMESKYHYFKRDISWLSFNYRVLLEADDDSLPL